ncbi:MAG: ABC transporter permease subunit [Actinomycetales bacterium]|nr:ABC transporter permease subunit [Actinomycetales bacterium]
MTTATLTAPTRSVKPVTFPRIVTSEWIKLRTVRATVWTLSVTVAVMVGLAALGAWSSTSFFADEPNAFAPASFPIGGWYFAQLVVVVLGVLSVTGEYSTGMIRSTFAAVPTRVPALLAKALTVFGVVLATATVAVGLSWLATLPFLGQMGVSIDLASAETWRLLLGAPLYLATITVLAFAAGALIRHSAGALALILGLLLVIENVFAAIAWRPLQVIAPFLPARAGSTLLVEDNFLGGASVVDGIVTLGPWQGYGVLTAWVVVLLGAACVLVRRRDA